MWEIPVEARSVGKGSRASPGHVVIQFIDNERMEGTATDLDLDRPDFELSFGNIDDPRRAIVPLPAVKCITFDRRPLAGWSADWPLQKVAVHFADGEVLDGLLGRPPQRRSHGIALTLVDPAGDEVQTMGLPYRGLKALFFLKSGDRTAVAASSNASSPSRPRRRRQPLLNLLREIESLESRRRSGEIDESDFMRRRGDVLRRI